MSTIAPMILVIGSIIIMNIVLDTEIIEYSHRELFACTILYIFIFSLLTTSPLNAVLSRYMSDIIYKERYEDILPCFYAGLIINIVLSAVLGIPFCLFEYFVGGVSLLYIFTGFCGYIALVLVFYTMLYLSICKDYGKISLFFLIGMVTSVLLSVLFSKVLKFDVMYSMLLAMTIGFTTIACLEAALIKSYFSENSGKYKEVLMYFKEYWQLVIANFLYTLGLYIHNFVFWTTSLRMTVANSFVCCEPYDLATCIAMFTNISASVIFISRVEMNFHEAYKEYSESIIGGRLATIERSKKRMFNRLSNELMSLVRIQFIISVILFLICIVMLPRYGFSGLVMQIYPCLAAGYFILFIMYAAIIFLYYFNDLKGAMITSICFCSVTFIGTIVSVNFTPLWYGAGFLAGSFVGWVVAYFRLRWVESNIDIHVFCQGNILKKGLGKKPSSKVYDVYQ